MYQQRIRETARSIFQARHIEGYMRSHFGTLDHLSPEEFTAEVRMAEECICVGGVYQAEKIAASFGL